MIDEFCYSYSMPKRQKKTPDNSEKVFIELCCH